MVVATAPTIAFLWPTIIAIFRVTLNLSELPYSKELHNNSTSAFKLESVRIIDAFDHFFADEPFYQDSHVHSFRFRQPLGIYLYSLSNTEFFE